MNHESEQWRAAIDYAMMRDALDAQVGRLSLDIDRLNTRLAAQETNLRNILSDECSQHIDKTAEDCPSCRIRKRFFGSDGD